MSQGLKCNQDDASSNLLEDLSEKIVGGDIPTFRSVGPEVSSKIFDQ